MYEWFNSKIFCDFRRSVNSNFIFLLTVAFDWTKSNRICKPAYKQKFLHLFTDRRKKESPAQFPLERVCGKVKQMNRLTRLSQELFLQNSPRNRHRGLDKFQSGIVDWLASWIGYKLWRLVYMLWRLKYKLLRYDNKLWYRSFWLKVMVSQIQVITSLFCSRCDVIPTDYDVTVGSYDVMEKFGVGSWDTVNVWYLTRKRC